MSRPTVAITLLAALLLSATPAHAYTYAYSSDPFCSHSVPLAVRHTHPIRVVCANPPQYQALGVGQFMGDVFASAFWSYVLLNPSMPHLGLERNNCAPPSSLQNDDWTSTARDSAITYTPNLGVAGYADLRESCSFDTGWFPEVVEADMQIRQSPNPVRAQTVTNPVFPDPVQANPCRAAWSIEGTLTHELGHGYGLLHFDDWMTTMVTYQQLDFVACDSVTGQVIPSSDVQQAFRNHPSYGMPGGRDLSGYNVYAAEGCNLRTNPSCFLSIAPDNMGGGTDYINPGPGGSLTRAVKIVYSNNRDALPSGYWVDFYISRDGRLDANDILVDFHWTGAVHSGAIYPMGESMTFDRNLLPQGRSCILALVDGLNQFSETNENDNVTLTRTCFDRSGW